LFDQNIRGFSLEIEILTGAKQSKLQYPWIKFGGFVNEGLKASAIHFVTRLLKKIASQLANSKKNSD